MTTLSVERIVLEMRGWNTMGVNVTDAAMRFLAAIKHELGVERYVEVVRAAETIRKERRASWIGQVHCELAMERLEVRS